MLGELRLLRLGEPRGEPSGAGSMHRFFKKLSKNPLGKPSKGTIIWTSTVGGMMDICLLFRKQIADLRFKRRQT